MASVRQKATAARAKEAIPSEVTGHQDHIGQMLRAAREERGLTVEMVADELMIRRFYLDALENGAFHDLPERVYATGFVRSYANYMGMDPGQCVEQFKRDAYGNRGGLYRVELTMPEPVIHSVVPNRTAIVSAVVLLCALLGGVIYFANTHHSDTVPAAVPAPVAEETPMASAPELTDQTPEETVPAVPAVPDTAVSFAATSSATPVTTPAIATTNAVPAALPMATAAATLPVTASSSPVATSAPAGKNETTSAAPIVSGLAVEALQSSWVEIKDAKGAVLFTSILKQGQQLPLPDQKGLILTTGNAGGLRLLRNGQPQQVLGATNEVKRNLSLDKLAKP